MTMRFLISDLVNGSVFHNIGSDFLVQYFKQKWARVVYKSQGLNIDFYMA